MFRFVPRAEQAGGGERTPNGVVLNGWKAASKCLIEGSMAMMGDTGRFV